MGVTIDEFLGILDRLPEVRQVPGGDWVAMKVRDKGFGYLWERTETVGLKATIDEQIALVSERPDVFEKQFTTDRFGWVVVHLAKIELDELTELVTEAWYLTAPKSLADTYEFPAATGEALPG
ncbi:hypothetical protein GCM10009677_04200 [Sphaerisporangium rubeum]|uniref:MmcQ/YjbR family DNA-binding protein n=1 Tax=Sphaerisporangium rubeum TaxID=321317 RepID=A0A7X0I8T1_9ACTN|nr:MmcQ/YjbR family DNA-binding protein [Sphaerisporangium rubeum]MBB6470737.1 hypothetical protein [Sphaerisporangium rubeum]